MDKKKIGGDGSLEDSYIQGVVTVSEIDTILGMVIVLEIVTVVGMVIYIVWWPYYEW